MTKKTKHHSSVINVKLTIISLIFYIIFQYFLLSSAIEMNLKILVYILIFSNVLFFLRFLYMISGTIMGKLSDFREKKYLKKVNPYIYFRELPNTFGIGVTTLLVDSTIENEKDVVAVILDLCAKRYLNLIKQGDKYIIKVLKDADDTLLENEKYILHLILNCGIKNIDYKEWFNYCMKDGINLGLFTENNQINKNEHPFYTREKRKKKNKRYKVIISLILSFSYFLIIYETNIFLSILYSGILYLIFYIVLSIVLGIKFSIQEDILEAKYFWNMYYNEQITNNLLRTDKGIEELHKLYAFKAFIRDFGNFVEKKSEEVILWDRYLSYAHVFGLTDKIMKCGYKELIENSSFCIDSIDNINLDNINFQ